MARMKTVLVTGAASGIGLEIAMQLSQTDNLMLLVDCNETVKGVAGQLSEKGVTSVPYVVDLANEVQVMSMVREIKEKFGGCDILINCAGVAPKRNGAPIPLDELATDDWDKVFHINLRAPFILCREFLSGMKERGFGRVVNIASVAGRTFRPRAGIDYSASKAGLIGLTKRLAGEFAPYGITINAVAPGRIHTPMSGMSLQESHSIAQDSIPMKRGGRVDELAATVCFLASDEASFITGACVDVNGGDYIG